MLENSMMPTARFRQQNGVRSLSRGMLLASTVLLTLPQFAWADNVYDGPANVVDTNTTASGEGGVYVGYMADGSLTISNGAVLSDLEGYIGQGVGLTGEVTVTGSETTWNNSFKFIVGNNGNGTLSIENGALVKSGFVYVGFASAGTVTVEGTGSELENTGTFYLGFYSDGTLNVKDGGLVESQAAYLGYIAGSSGTATVSGQGSTWQNTSELYVGYSGSGSLTIENGGVVSGLNAYVGNNANTTSADSVTVTGAGSEWRNTNVLNIGADGKGTLDIKDGGLVENKYGYIGNNVDGTGTVTVTGSGSTWNNTDGLYVGFYGNGTLNVEDGGLVESNEGHVGLFAGSMGTATVAGPGSIWNSTQLYIGDEGDGTLNIKNGGLVTSLYGYIGNSADSTGVVTVTGVGSEWQNTSNIYVGNDGDGTLNIEDGGFVESRTTLIGNSGNGTGTVTVTGNGSKWSDGGNIFVGYGGKGTLNVEDGGVVEDARGIIGQNTGSEGTATVTGSGSTWNSANNLTVGASGTGTLTIAEGGVVSVGTEQPDGKYNGTTYIAQNTGSTGTLIIGADSESDAVEAGKLDAATIKFGSGTGAIVFNHTDTDYDFYADMNGVGNINHLSGVTTFSGDSANFSGVTNVNGGTLYVTGTLGGLLYVNGTIGGTGTIGSTTIRDGGTLSPGLSGAIGELTIDGDLVLGDGSTYAVDLGSTAGDITYVSGQASIASGAGLRVTALDSETDYHTAMTYRIIKATDGLTGTFTDIVNNASAFLDVTTSYDENNAYLEVALKSSGNGSGVFVPVAETSNQLSVASALDTLDRTPGSASLALYNQLLLLSVEEARQTYQQLSGEVHAIAQGAFVQTNRAVNAALNSRVRAVTDGVAAPSSMALGYAEEKESPVKDDRFAAYETKKTFDTDRFATWINGFGSWGKVSGVNGEADTDTSNGGVLVGGDFGLGNDMRVGVLGGYSRSFFDTANSNGSSTNYHLGTYAGTKLGAVSFRTGMNYTWHDVGTTRNVTALGQTLSGDYDATSFNAYGELAYRLDVGKSALEPFAALAHSRTKTDGFGESGGTAALTVDSSTMNTTFTTVGLRTSTDFDLAGIASVARGTVGWVHAFGDVDPVSSARFLTGDSFAVSSTPIDRNAALLEAGLDFTITPASTLSFTYNGQIGSNSYDHGANAKLRVKF